MALELLRTTDEAAQFAEGVRVDKKRLALVPTMGFLHQGHLSLMHEGKRRADVLAVSIFVNPTQFGPREDFSRYPKDLQADLKRCEAAGVRAVFAPEPAEMYPPGHQTFVEVTEVSRGLCGERRPGHFRGVATVVAKLLALFRPQVAVFGEKDFQQLQVIRRLNRDLNLGAQIVGVPTVREADGLALSSRNVYLTEGERRRALSLTGGLREAQRLVLQGRTESRDLVAAVRHALAEAEVREDYVEVVDADTLERLERVSPTREARILVAAFVGDTRLIDNMALNADARAREDGQVHAEG
jgi:pantoate--beta-alanine ligase